MSLRSKLVEWLAGPQIREIQARYEAAYWNTNRSYLPGFIQSARADIDTMSRQEILRRVRYFEKNSPLLLKTLNILNVNVVGAGIAPVSSIADAGKAKTYNEWWNAWVPFADITGHLDVYGMQSVSYRAENVDGDILIDLTLAPNGRPALDLTEAHRFGSYGTNLAMMKAAGFRVFDGVVVDRYGRPAAYIKGDDFDAKITTVAPASSEVHLFNKKRPGQYRGITLFHAAILDLHDLDDLQKYEMRAAKDAASISKIIELSAGATTSDGYGMGASLNQLNTTDINGRTAFYKQALGGETILTQPGDKYEQFKSDRPSAATSGFWDKLGAKIAQGAGISEAALVDYKGNWGGATLRAAVQSDNRLYNLETIRLSAAWQKVWEYAISWAIRNGELDADPDWNKVRWHPPRRTTVDIGNDSSAMIEELKAGLRTYQDIYGELGEEWKDRLTQRADEERFLTDLAKARGIPKPDIASFAQERLAGQAPDAVGPATPPVPPGQGLQK